MGRIVGGEAGERAYQWLPLVLSLLILVAVALKVTLLLTSQSMADGDEAVEGIMAIDILESGAHPVYPYGIRYGAGAGVEAHLAAVLFALVGVSDIALKAVGLLLWSAGLATLFLIGRRLGGSDTGWLAGLLYASAPPTAQWSLKVAGGHNVALVLCLLVLLLIERSVRPRFVVLLLPFAALAHPIAAPFAVVLAVYLVARARSRERLVTAGALVAASVLGAFLLWPREAGVWNPMPRGWSPAAWLESVMAAAANLFTPNPSAAGFPGALALAVSLAWMACLTVAVARVREPRRLRLYALAPLGVVLLVDPAQLVGRHLLLLVPIGCLAIAMWLRPARGYRLVWIGALVLSGGALHALGITSPNVYGAGIQSRGVVRARARELIREIENAGVAHVYCLDPMFQWNIVFESRKRILARFVNPRDRVPEYAVAVDRARLAGRPVGLVWAVQDLAPSAAQVFTWRIAPPADDLERLFPRAPGGSGP